MRESNVTFVNQNAPEGGGRAARGEHVNIAASSSTLAFVNCHAMKGGGLYMSDAQFTAHAGTILFDSCTAASQGGAVFYGATSMPPHAIFQMSMQGTDVTFRHCTAGTAGGALLSDPGTLVHCTGRMRFQNCTAPRGGAMTTGLGVDLSDVQVENTAGLGAIIHSDSGNISIDNLTLVYAADGFADAELWILASHIVISYVDCTAVSQCFIFAKSVSVDKLRCPPGRWRSLHSYALTEHIACSPCQLQLLSCMRCSCVLLCVRGVYATGVVNPWNPCPPPVNAKRVLVSSTSDLKDFPTAPIREPEVHAVPGRSRGLQWNRLSVGLQ